MPKDKKSFFERLTGNIAPEEEKEELIEVSEENNETQSTQDWLEESSSEGQLTVDMYQGPTEIVIKAMVAGVKPEDLDVSITKDMITVKGHREQSKEVSEENYYYKELYWGGFSRTIMLPQEIDNDSAEAAIKNGVLKITLPKIDKGRTQKLKVKSD